jgi:hypothetical protein
MVGFWAKEDKNLGKPWPEARRSYLENLATKVEEKSAERASELLADENMEVLREHLAAAREYRYLAQKTAELQTYVLKEKIGQFENADDANKMKEAIASSKALLAAAKDNSLWMGVLDRAIGREREALNLDQYDINAMLKAVTAAGFEVKNVSEEAMKAALEAEGYKVEKVDANPT